MSTAEILAKAAEVIETRGWHRGHYMPQGSDRKTCSVCALGAINVAAGYPPDGDPDAYSDVSGSAEDAAAALVDWLGGLSVDLWNDAPERTAEQVIAVLREAAAELSGSAS